MHQPIKKILVGFDLSIGSQAAFVAALHLAREVDAAIHVLTAVPGALDPRVVQALREAQDSGADKYSREADFLEGVERLVRQELSRFEPGVVPVTIEIGELKASRMLMEVCQDQNPDVIFLGAVGNRPPKEGRTVGTDVERMIRYVAQPVYVMRPGNAFPPRRILVATDFSEAAENAFEWAVSLAKLTPNSTIDLVHVLQKGAGLTDSLKRVFPKKYSDTMALLAREDISKLLSRFDIEGIGLKTHLATGTPHEVILSRLNEGDYDLLVIGTLGRNPIVEMLIGGTAERVIRRSPTSILAIKPDTFVLKQTSKATGRLGRRSAILQ